MKKEFVMRGQTVDDGSEVLNFSGFKPGMAFKLTEFKLYGSKLLGTQKTEAYASITAGKTAVDPLAPDFRVEGLIAVAHLGDNESDAHGPNFYSVINDTFLITQNLILTVNDSSGTNHPVNWQCKFESVKMSGSEEAVTNYKQFTISDE